ncbi:hypothetical protein C3477_08675 [Mycobacterium kansasii]|uniref:alpha/beta fold hydrolase n=1 Tax=Mycobacterium kansasii TaxID=1768 RepID=UPI000CDD7DE7|nr:alpha/beta fold hydrolase [Mycobacterium kansasii]POX87369.1 hypothetical protein C3B43_18280 [Mycobacterium kansasii]POY07050.1 hypothetical protein C3477_08675 [Mycobacterium kansasii]POY17381.1 hypothetical protein C3476_21060 [Mycobacterium kansasii]
MAGYQRQAAGFGLLRYGPADIADPHRSLLAFPHGGGSPHSFARLSEELGPGYRVTAVDPPGRPRSGGPVLRDLGELVEFYLEHLPGHLLGGVLVGHSVGAYVASALAARLEQEGRPARAVVMSAVVPPAYLDPARPLSKMTDAQRLDWCRTLGTFPAGDKDSAALFALFAEVIRADCEVYESAMCVSLDHTTPLLVLVGDADPACPVQQVAHWPDTHPQAVIRTLPGGGHMLPQDAAPSYTAEVAGFLRSGRNGSVPTRRVAGYRRSWRREDMWLRGREGRRCLPVVLPRGRDTPAALAEVLVENDCLTPLLAEHGALLARGWNVADAGGLQAAAGSTGIEPTPYVGGNSPRTSLGNGVYTSTEYPPEAPISPHNEMSYADRWPRRLYFCCEAPAAQGGETLLADGRALVTHPQLEEVVDCMRCKGIRYLRTMHSGSGLGKSWQQTFETADREKVAGLLRDSGAAATWLPGGALRIVERRPAFIHDSNSGRLVWFNQAEQWHHSALPVEIRNALLDEFGEEGLPHNAAYGDGEPIPERHLDAIRDVLEAVSVGHSWRHGDVLVLDNVTTLHGRAPYRGQRRILVAMTDLVARG